MTERRRPSSCKKDDTFEPIKPIVSISTRIKIWLNARAAYFSSLCAKACLAALLAVTDVELSYDMAKVSVTVISQMVFFPARQGVSVRSSGRFPS